MKVFPTRNCVDIWIVWLTVTAGIGSGKAPLAQCQQLAARTTVTQNWRKCKHLIIDEISMVDGDFFDKMEAVAR